MPDSVIVIYGCTEFDLRTFSHSVFDQPDAEPVAAQIQIVGAVADRMPVAADQRRAPARRLAGTCSSGSVVRQDLSLHRRRHKLLGHDPVGRPVGADPAAKHLE